MRQSTGMVGICPQLHLSSTELLQIKGRRGTFQLGPVGALRSPKSGSYGLRSIVWPF